MLLVLLTRDAASGPAGRVTTVGDSLNVGMEPYLEGELRNWSVEHHNLNGRRTAEGVHEVRRLRGALEEVVVVGLGTNDAGLAPEAFRAHVDEVVALAGPRRCVIWLTIALEGPDALNAVLRDAVRRHPSLELADWAALVRDEPELLAFDGVHGTPAGYERRAKLVADVARHCRPDEAA